MRPSATSVWAVCADSFACDRDAQEAPQEFGVEREAKTQQQRAWCVFVCVCVCVCVCVAEELQHSSNALGIQQVRAARADRREHCLKNSFYSTRALPQEQLHTALATAPTHEHCLNLLYTTYTPALLLLLTPGIQQLTAALPVDAVEKVYSSTALLALPHLLLTAATVYSSAACLTAPLAPNCPPKNKSERKTQTTLGLKRNVFVDISHSDSSNI